MKQWSELPTHRYQDVQNQTILICQTRKLQSLQPILKTIVFFIKNANPSDRPYTLILRKQELIIFKNYQKKSIKFFLSFKYCKCQVSILHYPSKDLKAISLTTPNKKVEFSFLSVKILQTFIKILTTHVVTKKLYLSYSPDQKYWKKSIISSKQVLQIADTLDLLFFKNNNCACQIQRTFTQSSYDHVALFIKTKNNKLLGLQCVKNHGLKYFKWESFMQKQYLGLYQKVGYRKLFIPRSKSMMLEVQKFLQKIIGSKYNFSFINYLISFVTDTNFYQQQQDTYFCSSFIAQLFKKIGIMQDVKNSYQYLPCILC